MLRAKHLTGICHGKVNCFSCYYYYYFEILSPPDNHHTISNSLKKNTIIDLCVCLIHYGTIERVYPISLRLSVQENWVWTMQTIPKIKSFPKHSNYYQESKRHQSTYEIWEITLIWLGYQKQRICCFDHWGLWRGFMDKYMSSFRWLFQYLAILYGSLASSTKNKKIITE